MTNIDINQTQDTYTDRTVGEIVAADYRAAALFQRYGIDFCCGGDTPLAEACAEHGVALEALVRDLQQAGQDGSPAERYDQWSLDFLADYIVNQHHAYTRRMIPKLRDFAQTVAEVHGEEHPETRTIAELWHELSGELARHMQKEELMLFPYVKQLVRCEREGTPAPTPQFGSAQQLIQEMEDEHEFTGDTMARIAELSDDFTPPAGACNTYRALYARLQEMDTMTKQHVHLENNILFPKTIRLEERLANAKVVKTVQDDNRISEDDIHVVDEASSRFETFDVRVMPPPQRHGTILRKLDHLQPGEGFVLVNDHDPKPLYYELRSIRGETFEWEYLQRGPREWRVQIVKTEDVEIDDTKVTFDVRQIPPTDRHHTIFHRLGLLGEGESMELVNDHDPKPLYYQMRQKYGDRFAWTYLEQGPDRWRIEITKREEAGSDAGSEWDELDVRDYVPAERHRLIFDAYENLTPGEAFVLVNDHDPKPLYYQFEAETPGAFRWEYLQRGPGVWKVLIGKRA